METGNIHAFNWCIHCIEPVDLTFNEICYFVNNEFSETNVTIIEDEQIIKVQFPVFCLLLVVYS